MVQESPPAGKSGQREPVIIKKYANRRLYNTDTSTYVTLDNLAEMVRSERDFVVYDAKTGEDLTHQVLTQIIVEQESKGQNLLPIGFLRQLIRFYGNSIEQLVPSYLEFSLDTLTREQEKYSKQLASAFGGAAFEAMQKQARQNLEIFEKALNMFSPFGIADTGSRQHAGGAPAGEPSSANKQEPAVTASELAQLRAQLAEMQARLDKLSKDNDEAG